MESLWPKIIKTTGSVGVVAFLIHIVLSRVFSDQIVSLFGSEKMFVITIIVIALLLIILLVAILKRKVKSEVHSQTVGPKVTYIDHSTHNGDNNF